MRRGYFSKPSCKVSPLCKRGLRLSRMRCPAPPQPSVPRGPALTHWPPTHLRVSWPASSLSCCWRTMLLPQYRLIRASSGRPEGRPWRDLLQPTVYGAGLGECCLPTSGLLFSPGHFLKGTVEQVPRLRVELSFCQASSSVGLSSSGGP